MDGCSCSVVQYRDASMNTRNERIRPWRCSNLVQQIMLASQPSETQAKPSQAKPATDNCLPLPP